MLEVSCTKGGTVFLVDGTNWYGPFGIRASLATYNLYSSGELDFFESLIDSNHLVLMPQTSYYVDTVNYQGWGGYGFFDWTRPGTSGSEIVGGYFGGQIS